MSAGNLNLGNLIDRTLGYQNTHSGDSHYGSLITDWINDAQLRMVSFSECLEGDCTINSISGQRTYPVPTDLIRFKLITFNGLVLTPRGLITQDFFDSGTNTYPDRYAVWNNQIFLGPLPPADEFPIRIFYYREPSVLSDTTDCPEVPNRFRPYLSDYAAANQFIADGALQDAQVMMSRFNQACQELSDWQRNRTRSVKTIVDSAGYF